jgi:hypothetical protein
MPKASYAELEVMDPSNYAERPGALPTTKVVVSLHVR